MDRHYIQLGRHRLDRTVQVACNQLRVNQCVVVRNRLANYDPDDDDIGIEAMARQTKAGHIAMLADDF